MPIPPVGWGAVEMIIDEMSSELAVTRPTTVLNAQWVWLWFRAFRTRYDVIHVHSEVLLRRATRWRMLANRTTPIIAWSHNPYLGQPASPSAHSRFVWSLVERSLRGDDVFVALNPSIADDASARLSVRVLMLPNGSSFDPRVEAHPSRGLLIVGKVDPRKRQYELSELALQGIDITCVGPIADERVDELIAHDPGSARAQVFVGQWTRSMLAAEMSRYRVLLLPSHAEADALVLYEGQLAGLSIVCSRAALGAQDARLPWVYTYETGESVDRIRQLCETALEENATHRPAIVEYARSNFSWSDRVRRLDECLAGSGEHTGRSMSHS